MFTGIKSVTLLVFMCLVSNSLPRQLFANLRQLFLSRVRNDSSSPHAENSIYPSRHATPLKSPQYSKPLTVAYFHFINSCDDSKGNVVVLSRRVSLTFSLLVFVLVSHSSSYKQPRDQTRLCVTRGLYRRPLDRTAVPLLSTGFTYDKLYRQKSLFADIIISAMLMRMRVIEGIRIVGA